VIIAYDDSDGWYDHAMPPIVNQSQSTADALTGLPPSQGGTGNCGTGTPAGGYQARCGYGPRQPLLVISPWAKPNFVDHQITDQTSILRFIEDNWLSGERIGDHSFDAIAGPLDNMFNLGPGVHPSKLFLDPLTGQQ
jgi:phospholipase C